MLSTLWSTILSTQIARTRVESPAMGTLSLAIAGVVVLAPTLAAADEVEDILNGTTGGGPSVDETVTNAPGEVEPTLPPLPRPEPPRITRSSNVEQDAGPWGFGARVAGLSGIGQLPGRNYGGELAIVLRRDELFGELALGRWRPEKTYVVVDTPQRTELGLDLWTVRGGWAARTKPLRLWMLAEVGELANADGMLGVARMITMAMPSGRRWVAMGAGIGVAWPMAEHARLIGTFEVAVPVDRNTVMLERSEFRPDPAAARCALGVEFGWR
jgi:hypothetical protein